MSNDYDLLTPEQRSPIGRLMRWCMTNKLVVALAVVGVAVWGLVVLPFDRKAGPLPRSPVPTDAIPDIGENQQIVFTEWMGRSPKDVEDQITDPLTRALSGVKGVKTVRASSMFGFSTISVIFEDFDWYDRVVLGRDFDWTRTRVLEKLASLPSKTLPDGIQPTLGPDATALGQVYWYTLEGRDEQDRPTGGWDLEELRTVQDWLVRYGLLTAQGVSEVASVGGFVREYQVDADPDAMRFYGVTLPELMQAVKASNLDVGAKTIEHSGVEYFVRGVGFIKSVADIANSVIKVNDNVPILVQHVATVTLGPAMRRGALDKDGAEAVGGVVVARYGANPLAVIKNVKGKIDEIAGSLDRKVLIDRAQIDDEGLRAYAADHGFEAFAGGKLDQPTWIKHIRSLGPDDRPAWATLSQVTIVPFYDRTGLIYETLGTLDDALTQEILITFIVVILMVMHLRSSLLIGGMLPLAVLGCFIAMKTFGVDANIVALSGIAIAIGAIVDMGIVVSENILRRLEEAPPDAPRLEVVHRAASEVGSAVLTAVATTVVSFLPVFMMTGAEGKLFKPLAFTKTFALVASIVIALTVIPPAAYVLFCGRISSRKFRAALYGLLAMAGAALVVHGVGIGSGLIAASGVALLGFGVYNICQHRLSDAARRWATALANVVVVVLVGVLLSGQWEPLGPQRGAVLNFLFVVILVGLLLGFFRVFQWAYPWVLRAALRYKLAFLSLPGALVILGAMVWLGFATVLPWAIVAVVIILAILAIVRLYGLAAAGGGAKRSRRLLWTIPLLLAVLGGATWATVQAVDLWRTAPPETSAQTPAPSGIRSTAFWVGGERKFPGLGKEFRPPLDEGSYLFMPTTMTHASIGTALKYLSLQDKAFRAIPEIESAVGKIGRAETPLDPAPISMIETVINYKSEYITDADGRRVNFRYDKSKGQFVRDANGELIAHPDGRPFRQWRDSIRTPDDIWDEIVRVGQLPGVTTATKLQPIAARIVMLQSGMRAPMGIRIKGPDSATIEKFGIELEGLLKQVPGVKPSSVVADRIVAKPYWEIEPDSAALAQYGVMPADFQKVIEAAIGGMRVTTTVEGRERFGVRVRYQRELRDSREAMGRVLVPGSAGQQVPLEQLAEIRYVPGPQVIKSEDTALVGYVLFDKLAGVAEVDVVERAAAFLESKIVAGELTRPAGVSYAFAGTYENHIRAQRKLAWVLPLALFAIFIILYFQFHSVSTTLLVFSGIFVAWAGGFLLLWLYGRPWFLDFSAFGVNLRDLFQIHTINLSVAVWVGFLALFGIATDNGVIQSTYLNQVFRDRKPTSTQDIHEATVAGAQRRVRPCLMTTATTILALIPILTSTGRGSDVMVPMAIPSFGGMLVVLLSIFVVPVLYCWVAEQKLRLGMSVTDTR